MSWTALGFRIISGMRLAAALGLVITGVGVYLGHAWMALTGLFVWAFAFPAATSLFWANFASGTIQWAWLAWRAKKQAVPGSVLDLCDKAGVKPPEVMKVLPTKKINAGVRSSVLYVTDGFTPLMDTPGGRGILAHEVGHLAVRNRKISFSGACAAGLCALAVTALFSFPSGLFGVAIFLTVAAPIMQRASWRAEYDADRTGAQLAGAESVLVGFRLVADSRTWALDCDSHPSFSKREERLLESTA